MKRIVNFGVRKGLCPPLPFTIEVPRVNNLETEDLSSEQLTRLFEAIEADKHAQAGPIMKMALFTGLRHVYASILPSSGQVDLYTLQKLLTHKSPLMTQRYAHLRDEALRRASDLAGNLIE